MDVYHVALLRLMATLFTAEKVRPNPIGLNVVYRRCVLLADLGSSPGALAGDRADRVKLRCNSSARMWVLEVYTNSSDSVPVCSREVGAQLILPAVYKQ